MQTGCWDLAKGDHDRLIEFIIVVIEEKNSRDSESWPLNLGRPLKFFLRCRSTQVGPQVAQAPAVR